MNGSEPVLVVDDDEDTRDMMKLTLELEGLSVQTAADGLDALDRLRSGLAPSLILLDLRMPQLNGLEFLELTRREPGVASIPVVVLTGDAAASTKACAAGAVACLRKPIDADELVEVVRRHGRGRAAA